MTAPVRNRYDVEEPSIGDLVSGVSSNVQQLIKREVELAKLETKEQLSKATKAGAMFGATGVAAFVGLLIVAMAAGWGLAEVMAPGLAFAIVGVVFFVAAGVLFATGKRKLTTFTPVPEQTLHTLKQDMEVAKESFSTGAAAPTGTPRRTWDYWTQEEAR